MNQPFDIDNYHHNILSDILLSGDGVGVMDVVSRPAKANKAVVKPAVSVPTPVDPAVAAKRDLIRSLIFAKCDKGQMFTATFVKQDGTVRDMNCRLGVTKHLHGGESTTAHKPNLLTVYDMQSAGYRCINLDTVTGITIAKNKVSFG